jgi:hypothetical protein
MPLRGVHIEILGLSHRSAAKPSAPADMASALPRLALEHTGLGRAKGEMSHDTMVTAR